MRTRVPCPSSVATRAVTASAEETTSEGAAGMPMSVS